MKYKLLLTASLLFISLTAHSEWFLRGTHNGWGATQMDSAETPNAMVLNNVVFTKAGAIKFDRFGDWFENYGIGGSSGANIPVGSGVWKITFFTDTKHWLITPLPSTYHLRGTFNGWAEGTLMNKVVASNTYEYCHNGSVNSNLQFKVDPNGGWGGDELPAANYSVANPGWIKIIYDASTKKITTQKNLSLHCGKEIGTFDNDIAAIHQATFCNSPSRNIAWINSTTELDAFLKNTSDSQPSFPTPNFSTHKLLVLHSGERPSTGYGLKLVNSSFDKSTTTWNIVIEDTVPPTNSAQLTIMTSPCLTLQVPIVPNATVQIKDINGNDFFNPRPAIF